MPQGFRLLLPGLFFGLLICFGGASSGQELTPDPEEGPSEENKDYQGIEEIVVTAEKRSSDLQKTPTAITALSGVQLFDRGIYDVEALASQVPNLHYGEVFGLSRITIRGIGVQGFNDPSTAFHIDGVYQNNPTAASALTFYDLQQIEVLRGPQGTLWGRNSTAGAINVATRRPTHEREVFGDLLFGSYDQVFGRGVVNVPLVEEKVAMRVAGFYRERDGYQDNLFVPGDDQDADDAKNWGIRPQLLFEITEDAELVMRGTYSHQGGVGFGNKIVGDYPGVYLFTEGPPNGGAPNWVYADPYNSTVVGYGPVRPNPQDSREVRKDAHQFQDVSTWDVNGTLEWDFAMPGLGDVTFSAVGSYKEENRTQSFDGDLTEQAMVVANIAAWTKDRGLDAHLRSNSDIQATMPFAGEDLTFSTEWILGFFALDADGYLDVQLPGVGRDNTIFVGPGGSICNGNDQPLGCPNAFPGFNLLLRGAFTKASTEVLSLAPYGHMKFGFLEDTLNFGLGLRYSYDRKTGYRQGGQVDALATGFLTLPIGCVFAPYNSTTEADWDGVSGDFKVEYLPADEHMVYGSVSRGYKPGVINGDSVSTNCAEGPQPEDPAKKEKIWAYEIGTKNRFLDNQLQANLTAFYYDYEDLQVRTQVQDVTMTSSAEQARIWGIEFEGIWMPIDELRLSVIYGYLNAKYTDYNRGWDYALPSDQNPQDFSGHRMIRAPEHTATFAAEYTYALESYGSLISRIQYFVSDEIYFSASNRPEDREPSYGKLEARLRWEALEEDLFIEASVENITDETIRSTRAIGNVLLGRPVTAAFEPPRTWGIRVGGNF